MIEEQTAKRPRQSVMQDHGLSLTTLGDTVGAGNLPVLFSVYQGNVQRMAITIASIISEKNTNSIGPAFMRVTTEVVLVGFGIIPVRSILDAKF